MKKNTFGFTLTELLVSILIMVILSGIAFFSFSSYIPDARNSQRKQDLSKIISALKTFHSKRWYYPLPWDYFTIQYNGNDIAYQGKLNPNTRISTIDELPKDPKNNTYYTYSVTKNRQEFQIGLTLEDESSNGIALTGGDYSSVSKNIVPTILVAAPDTVTAGSTFDIATNTDAFIFNNQNTNLLYIFDEEESNTPSMSIATWVNLPDYWQNSDFRSCAEIQDAGKLLIAETLEYQVVDENWALVNVNCP